MGRYLLGAVPPTEITERYAAAVGQLAAGEAPDAVLAAALRCPVLLPLLDAACGLRRPGCVLRKRLLIMTAILETHPAYAERYMPRARGIVSLVAMLSWDGSVAVAKAVLGVPVLALVEAR